MPKFKANETEFSLAVVNDGQRYNITVPKILYNRLDEADAIHGTFTLTKDAMVLREEYQEIGVERLLSQWWPVPDGLSRELINEMDWDELLMRLGLAVDDYEGKNVVVGDFNDTEFDSLHISFIED